METQPKETQSKLVKKILVILGITIGLFILLLQVEDQVKSRQDYEAIAHRDMKDSWGGDVKVQSPRLTESSLVSFQVSAETEVTVTSEERKKGVFRIPVYTATYQQKITFPAGFPQQTLFIPIRGVNQLQEFHISDAAGKKITGILSGEGLEFSLPDSKELQPKTIDVRILLRGTGRVLYQSDLQTEKIIMKGNWPKPQYADEMLPTSHTSGPNGFSAEWNIMNFPGKSVLTEKSQVLGMNHLWIHTEYSMVLRALKYGILFIAMTFLFTFLLEIIANVQIHAFQYALVGLSLTIFYLLLLALSEVIEFNISYLAGTLMVVGLNCFYLHGFMEKKKHVLWAGAEQITLSGFFFVLLRLEERSLLVGTMGLFLALALLMVLTRKINWAQREASL